MKGNSLKHTVEPLWVSLLTQHLNCMQAFLAPLVMEGPLGGIVHVN